MSGYILKTGYNMRSDGYYRYPEQRRENLKLERRKKTRNLYNKK